MKCEICKKTIGVKSYSFYPKLSESHDQFGATHITSKTYSGIPLSISLCDQCIIDAIKNDIRATSQMSMWFLIISIILFALLYFFIMVIDLETLSIIIFILMILAILSTIIMSLRYFFYKMKLSNKNINENDGDNLAGNWYFEKNFSIVNQQSFLTRSNFNKLKNKESSN
ncbi:MAG: hypothetical protein AB1521_03845 [Bacteroidota bacterium]